MAVVVLLLLLLLLQLPLVRLILRFTHFHTERKIRRPLRIELPWLLAGKETRFSVLHPAASKYSAFPRNFPH